MYTFWDYKRNRWPRDAGLRLDHLLLSPVLAPRLIKAGVDRKVRAEEGASDHAPAWIVLRQHTCDPSRRKRSLPMVRRRSCAVSNHEATVQSSSFETRRRRR